MNRQNSLSARALWLAVWLGLAVNLGYAGGGFAPGDGPDNSAHDPSTLIRCGNEYWVFSTAVGIKSLRSTNLTDWRNGPRVFNTMPAWVTNVVPNHRGHFWAPDIIAVSNRFLLYYSISSWGKNRSAIALASNATLDPADARFQWRDDGIVLESHSTNDFNAIDPCLIHDTDGSLYMAFGSFWGGIKIVELNPATGHRREKTGPIYSLARYSAIEAPFLYRRGKYYYLFVNWDLCCRGISSTYNIRVGRAERITGPYRDKNGADMLNEGGSLFLDSQGDVIGPGHAGILAENGREWFSFHYYDGRRRGRPTLGIRPLQWTADGWPELEIAGR